MDTAGQGEESAQDGCNIPPMASADVSSANDDDAMVSIATELTVVYPLTRSRVGQSLLHQDSPGPRSHDESLYGYSRHIYLTPPEVGDPCLSKLAFKCLLG